MNKVHLIGHTHWDREWYFTAKDSYVLMSEVFKRVVDDLETNESVYILDAQSSILEDFINFVPTYKERTINLIKQGRLIVGPWYTQTDCIYVGAESIIQNLKIGKQIERKYGGNSNIAYLPDTFGFNSQMPSILNACSIDQAIIRRGVDYQYHGVTPYFKWQSENNDSLKTIHLYKGYGELGHLTLDKQEKLEKYIDYIKSYSNSETTNFICLCGGDQTEINSNHATNIKLLNSNNQSKYEYIDSSIETFFESLSDEDFSKYSGDLRLGRFDRVHRSIGSSRYDIKTRNYELENYLYKTVNPLIAIAKQFEIDIEQELITFCIKKLAENQAHDSMGGCVTDEVYEDIKYRYKEVKEILDGIVNTITYRIHELLDLNPNQLIIFNTSAVNEKINKSIEIISYDNMIDLDVDHQVIKIEKVSDFSEQGYHNLFTVKILGEIPTFGFKVVTISKLTTKFITEDVKQVKVGNVEIEKNESNFSIKVFGKPIDNFISFADCGNDGDTYDFSPLRGDCELIFEKADQVSLEKVGEDAILNLEYNLELPVNLEHRITNTKKETLKVNVLAHFSCEDNVNLKIHVDNNVLSHRLRILINSAINSNKHIRSVPFTSIIDTDHELQIENFEAKGFVEDNLDLKVLDNTVTKYSDEYSLTVKSHGLKEYQIIGSKIAVTLFATTSEFGKGDLLSRPGRASGDTQRVGHKMIATPCAEYLGENTFELELFFSNEISEKIISNYIDISNSNLVGFQKQVIDKFINRLDNKLFDINPSLCKLRQFSLLSSKHSVINIEKFKSGYLVRVENPSDEVAINQDYFENYKVIYQCDAFGENLNQDQFILNAKTCSTFYIERI